MQEVDARGLSCPQPVVLISNALKDHPQEKEFTVLVDDFAPLENVTRFAETHGLSVQRIDKGDYTELHCQR